MNHAILCTHIMYVLYYTYISTGKHALMQLGKTSGRSSVSIAVDVAMNLMGITPKFTLDKLWDNITQYNCGTWGQCRKFHQFIRSRIELALVKCLIESSPVERLPRRHSVGPG